MISELEQGAELAKVGMINVFRSLPIYPGDFELVGFK